MGAPHLYRVQRGGARGVCQIRAEGASGGRAGAYADARGGPRVASRPPAARARGGRRAGSAWQQHIDHKIAAASSSGGGQFGDDPSTQQGFALSDIDELDLMMKAAVREDEDQLNIELSESLLQNVIREVADDLEAIDRRRGVPQPKL